MKPISLAFLSLVSALLLIPTQAQDRPAEKAGKGMELYSWLDSNRIWTYSLVPGTNRLKTEEEIKEKRNQISSMRELEKRFSQLAEDEYVTWFHGNQKHGFAYPDSKTIDEIVACARRAKIELRVEKNHEHGG